MKQVRFNRDMAPHVKGETRVVPDAVAERLVAADDAVVVPSVFDAQRAAEPEKPKRGAARLTRRLF